MNTSETQQKLLDLVHLILKTGMSIDSTQLPTRINEIVQSLSQLESDPTDFSIPLNVLECVDNGINPDLILKQQLQTIVDKNQKTKGRILSLELLKDEITNQMKLHFPDLII
jgi:hypothetical protein